MKAYNKDLVSQAQILRKNMTPEEKHLWYDFLKRLPMRVHRQYNIGNYIVDFYIPQKRLIIEIDGIQHLTDEHKEKDQIRDQFLEAQNLSVLRLSNESIRKNFTAACQVILDRMEVTFRDLKEE